MDEIKVMQVIYSTKQRRGEGVELDPIRCITEIYDFNGNLIAENDCAKIYTLKEMVSFALFVSKEEHLSVDIITLFKKWEKIVTNK